jgi:hypothetical protein
VLSPFHAFAIIHHNGKFKSHCDLQIVTEDIVLDWLAAYSVRYNVLNELI